jgi:hypothetical protein
VFAYREINGGSKEPFDWAVCLCEFNGEDRLRLLPGLRARLPSMVYRYMAAIQFDMSALPRYALCLRDDNREPHVLFW